MCSKVGHQCSSIVGSIGHPKFQTKIEWYHQKTRRQTDYMMSIETYFRNLSDHSDFHYDQILITCHEILTLTSKLPITVICGDGLNGKSLLIDNINRTFIHIHGVNSIKCVHLGHLSDFSDWYVDGLKYVILSGVDHADSIQLVSGWLKSYVSDEEQMFIDRAKGEARTLRPRLKFIIASNHLFGICNRTKIILMPKTFTVRISPHELRWNPNDLNDFVTRHHIGRLWKHFKDSVMLASQLPLWTDIIWLIMTIQAQLPLP